MLGVCRDRGFRKTLMLARYCCSADDRQKAPEGL